MYTLVSSQYLINFIDGIMVGFSLSVNEIKYPLPTPFLIIMLFYKFLLDKKCITQYGSGFVIVPFKLTLINGSNIFDVVWVYFVSNWYQLVL